MGNCCCLFFLDFCIELIKNSTKDLHDMFQKTYGVLYLQNAQIFANLFSNLQNFFRGRDLDLHEVLEKFFAILFQRMFALLNTSYSFDKKYLDCVAEYMDDLRPFGDVPQKLSVHIRRAFVAAATFMQGLRIGQNTLRRISQVWLFSIAYCYLITVLFLNLLKFLSLEQVIWAS